MVIYLCPYTGLIILVLDPDELAVFLQIVAFLGFMVASVPNEAISATVYDEGVLLVLLTLRR